MTDIAISVKNLSKCFQIYETPRDRLKQFVLPRLQRFAGKTPKQHYREFWALKDVSFEIKKGETVGIVGRNGSGKSTLLQIICGTLTPTSGSVETRGRVAALLELGSGFNPEFTGRENVYMNAAVLGLSQQEIDQRFDDIVAFADIGDFIEQPVKTYSSGMMVRLAFAVAINVDPEILIVDEALSVGDELFQRKCFSRIESIKNNGATILFVSHSASMINQLCDKAMLLDRGGLLLNGSARNVTKYYHQLLFANSENEDEVVELIRKDRLIDVSLNFDSKKVVVEKPIENYVKDISAITALSYQENGGEILSFELQNAEGIQVNIVSTGFSGFVKLVVKFSKSFQDVIFGFHLKSMSGLELSGLSFPRPQQPLFHVTSGDTVEIKWGINLPLVAGTYFFTYGVRSTSEEGFIARIVDGSVVKVVKNSNSAAFGLFDISNQGQFWARKIN